MGDQSGEGLRRVDRQRLVTAPVPVLVDLTTVPGLRRLEVALSLLPADHSVAGLGMASPRDSQRNLRTPQPPEIELTGS